MSRCRLCNQAIEAGADFFDHLRFNHAAELEACYRGDDAAAVMVITPENEGRLTISGFSKEQLEHHMQEIQAAGVQWQTKMWVSDDGHMIRMAAWPESVWMNRAQRSVQRKTVT